MNSILDYLEIIENNAELQPGDFFVLNGESSVYSNFDYSPKDIENAKDNISIILRPKSIDSFFILEIYELFKMKCKKMNLIPSTRLFQAIILDISQLFKAVKERNDLKRSIIQKTYKCTFPEVMQHYMNKQKECLSLIKI